MVKDFFMVFPFLLVLGESQQSGFGLEFLVKGLVAGFILFDGLESFPCEF